MRLLFKCKIKEGEEEKWGDGEWNQLARLRMGCVREKWTMSGAQRKHSLVLLN
jgi:hypothetical protein